MVNTSITTSRHPGVVLGFIPQHHLNDFVDEVLRMYMLAAEEPWKTKNGETVMGIPDVVEDVAQANNDFFVIGCAYYEEKNPYAFEHRLDAMETQEEEWELLEDMHSEYDDEFSSYLFSLYIEDILAVCHHYQLAHFHSFPNPFEFRGRYYSLHHYPIVGVW